MDSLDLQVVMQAREYIRKIHLLAGHRDALSMN